MSVTDKELAELTKNVNKALNPREKPLDTQLVRAIILLTHRTREACSFWQIANRQNLTINRFTAWKFCSLLHKLLRDGHPQVIRDSLRHQQKLQEIGNYWAWQRDEVGQCTARYCKVLLAKLTFHETYTFFNGNLQITGEQSWDVNICFQLCSDIFELLDDLLQLQATIFTGINTQKLPSASMQRNSCLMSLVAVTAECAALYELTVMLMRQLSAQLPLEDVAGMRDRFQCTFEELQRFYDQLRREKFIVDMAMVPELPAFPPSFYTQHFYPDLPMPSAPLASELDSDDSKVELQLA